MITILQKGGEGMVSTDWTLFMIDSESDIQALPTSTERTKEHPCCAMGSMAMSSDGKIIAMLGNDDKWHKWA